MIVHARAQKRDELSQLYSWLPCLPYQWGATVGEIIDFRREPEDIYAI